MHATANSLGDRLKWCSCIAADAVATIIIITIIAVQWRICWSVDIGFMLCAMLVIINSHFNAQSHTCRRNLAHTILVLSHQISDIKILIKLLLLLLEGIARRDYDLIIGSSQPFFFLHFILHLIPRFFSLGLCLVCILLAAKFAARRIRYVEFHNKRTLSCFVYKCIHVTQ